MSSHFLTYLGLIKLILICEHVELRLVIRIILQEQLLTVKVGYLQNQAKI